MGQKKKILLFGRGMVYERKKEVLFRDYEVEAFLDNAISESDDSVTDERTGVPVIHPASIARYPESPVVLLSYALGDMYRQLLDLGVSKKRIWFGVSMSPYDTFEKMLFESNGRLVPEGREIFYINEEQKLRVRVNSSDLGDLRKTLQENIRYPDAGKIIDCLPLHPLDDAYGMNRGTPVDRYYIEQFLESQKEWIHGTVMEIGDRAYTLKFGGDRVADSIVLHVDQAVPENHQIKGNFATGEGLKEESVDCLICTQTLPFIYDIHSAVNHMMRILRRGGTILMTVGGISQIIQYEKIHYGHFWSFTDQSLKRIFEENPEVDSVEIFTYGNVKTAAAFLYGISFEELSRTDLEPCDPSYQLIIGAVVRKK